MFVSVSFSVSARTQLHHTAATQPFLIPLQSYGLSFLCKKHHAHLQHCMNVLYLPSSSFMFQLFSRHS